MKQRSAFLLIASIASVQGVFAGIEHLESASAVTGGEAPPVEFAIESAYLLGIFNPPHSYRPLLCLREQSFFNGFKSGRSEFRIVPTIALI